jgi:polyribonucleotide nucleotidyltransferase
LDKNCTKAIELVLKKFDQSKEERDLELEKIKVEALGKIESLKDDNKVKVLISENDKLLNSDFKKLTKNLMRSQIINDGKRVDGRELDEVRKIKQKRKEEKNKKIKKKRKHNKRKKINKKNKK